MTSELYYPFEWWQFFNHRARLRRRQLSLSLAKLKQPVPYARFLYSMSFVWFVVNFLLFFFNWVFQGILLTNLHWIFVIYLIVSGGFILSAWVHAWVMKYWPSTIKVQVGNSFPVSVGNFTPGSKIDSVELATVDAPDPKREPVDIEIILGGGVNNLPIPKPRGPAIIARAQFTDKKGKRSGFLAGTLYYVPCKPELYVLGDLKNWRGVDWAQKINDHYKDQVNDFTRVILALDPMDPETWDVPADPVTIKRELYESRQRTAQLERDLGDWVLEDTGRKSSKEDEL